MTETKNPNSEVIFYSTRYSTSGGTKITFALPDRELSDQLDALGAGKRYMMVLVPLADDETPDIDALEAADRGKKRVTRAVLLCEDKAFWDWLREVNGDRLCDSKEDAKALLCGLLEIKSRSEIRQEKVGVQFERMETDFKEWAGRIPPASR